MALKKPELNRSELYTVRRALAVHYTKLKQTMKQTKRSQDAGKKTRNSLSSLAMEAGEISMLFDRLNDYLTELEANEQGERT